MEIITTIVIVYFIYKLFIKPRNKLNHNIPEEFISDDAKATIRTKNYSLISSTIDITSNYSKPILDKITKIKVKDLKKAISNLDNSICNKKIDFIDRNYKIQYPKELNKGQLKAIQSTYSKILLIAGAGSGKTRTLTYRASFLLENNVMADNILILTFTKKAAVEIKQRINNLLGGVANNITSGTFHSFCNSILVRHSKILNISPTFTILDARDSEDLLGLVKREQNFKSKYQVIFPTKSTLYNIISSSRNKRMTIQDIVKQDYLKYRDFIDDILSLEKLYTRHKRERNLYDYDDLIDEVIKHLQSNPLFKKKMQNRYKHIMIDEYQDTNLPQKELIDLFAESDDISLMAIGDDNQSIYSFRGADYKNILLFGKTYKNATLIKLEENYRSTPYILSFINNISDNILLGYNKSLFSKEQNTSSKPTFTICTTDEQEAEFIADEIVKANSRLEYKEIAVLSRAGFHANSVQAEFLKRNIPFVVIGGLKLIERRHVKDILAYIKILWNPLDTIAWHRILTLLEGIGEITATKITEDIKHQKGQFMPLQNYSYLKKNKNIKLLYETLSSVQNANSLISAFDIIEKYYIPILKKIESNWQTRIEDFKIIRKLCAQYGDAEQLLSNLALDPPNEKKGSFHEGKPLTDVVTISTIHSAKGLEWNTVFIICLLDGAIPYYRSFKDFEQLEEERKLFYVACSRAKENLYLTAPLHLKTYNAYFDKTSRFIDEIEEKNYSCREMAL